ncbi:hypothetical protein RBB50_001542 [Rhinocladiella similis]
MATDITRWARDYDIPWTPGWPANYPSKSTTLKVQRFLTACSKECPQQYPKIITALYYAFWFDKKAVQLPEVYEPIATYTLGEEVTNTIIKRSSSEDIKNLLKHNTDQCIASGSPGVPWLKCVNAEGQEECYWGFDHLGQVARHLGLGKLDGPHL